MRFPDSPVYLANAEAMGAEATAVAFEEVYLSLQQGIVDGQENPIDPAPTSGPGRDAQVGDDRGRPGPAQAESFARAGAVAVPDGGQAVVSFER